MLTVLGLLRPSYADEREGILVKGSESGYVDVFVHQFLDIRESDIVVRGAGRFTGFYLMPDTATRHPIGGLAVPSLGAGGDSGGRLVPLGSDYQIAPGSYRLYLIADGPAEVFIPIPDEPLIDVRPHHRTSATLSGTSFVTPAAAMSDERRLRLHAHRSAVVAAVQRVQSDGLTGVDYVATCLVPASHECRRSPAPTTRAPLTTARSSSYATVRPGSYDAAFRVERGLGIHADTKVDAGVFSLDLAWLKGAPFN